MRFPVNVSKQARCPVCRKPGPGTDSPATPRPEVASLSFAVASFVRGRSYPVFLGSHLMLAWDSGISKHPRSRTSVGAALVAAKKDARAADAGAADAGTMDLEFCSTRCMRRFFKQAVDELDRRIKAARDRLRPGRREAAARRKSS